MNAPSLKHTLAHWTGFPTIERTFEPRRTTRTAAEVEKSFGNSTPREPAAYDLQDVHRRVAASWRRDRSLAPLDGRDLRRLPWVLFYPPRERSRIKNGDAERAHPQAELFDSSEDGGPADWLGAKRGIVQEYGGWLSGGRRTRPVVALLCEYLRVYPVALPTFNELRLLLQDTVEAAALPAPASLQRWRQRCRDFGLLEAGGAGAFVQKLMSAADTPEDVLRQAGLDDRLARCGFLESGIRTCLPHVELLLTENRFDVVQLDRLLAFLEFDGGLRFDDRAMRSSVATALLRPFTERPPGSAAKETRKSLRPFFLRHFGDPRLRSGKHRWSGVPPENRRVVIRWINERALEQFFLLVKETALDRHWRYREAFWRAFLPLDPDIWFVLGRQARSLLRKMNAESEEPEATATLLDAQSDQSVLLLRMSGVTIVEWSHNGACRFWLGDTRGAPTLYEDRYFGSELKRGADNTQRHDGSPAGRWQDEIVKWLRENTGIEIARAEYFPDRLHEWQPDHDFQRTPTDRRSPDRTAAAESRLDGQPQSARTETVALLVRVRNAVVTANRLRVNLRDFMRTGSPAWMAYVADHGWPGHRTRRQTVLDRLDSTIVRLRSP